MVLYSLFSYNANPFFLHDDGLRSLQKRARGIDIAKLEGKNWRRNFAHPGLRKSSSSRRG